MARANQLAFLLSQNLLPAAQKLAALPPFHPGARPAGQSGIDAAAGRPAGRRSYPPLTSAPAPTSTKPRLPSSTTRRCWLLAPG
ncbi:MAG: hypothetical protein WKG07_28865 [Hymenobacter sp.]